MIIYLGLMFFAVFFINDNTPTLPRSTRLNELVVGAWGLMVFLDSFIYSVIKIMINYAMLKMSEKQSGCMKGFFDVMIDENIANAFGREWVN